MNYLVVQVRVAHFQTEQVLVGFEEGFVEVEVPRFGLLLQHVTDDASQRLHRSFGHGSVATARRLHCASIPIEADQSRI